MNHGDEFLKKKIIAHLVTPYLFHTGSWIYSQIIALKNYSSAVFTQRKENISQFPLSTIVSSEDFSFLKQVINRVYRKVSGNFGLFFNSELKKIQPVLFHAHMGYEGVRWLSFVKKYQLPLITTFYGQDVSKLSRIPRWKDGYKYLFEYGNLFLAEGNFLRKQLIEIGCPEEKIRIQHLGVDINKYPQKTYLEKKKIVILQIASFREKKGIEYSICAVSNLAKEFTNLEFRIIGNGVTGDEEKKLRSLVSQRGITNIVTFIGAIPHNDLLNHYLDADIFLHPSVTANDGDNEGGSPVSITEASVIGLPVVSTYHADIPEVVLHDKTGLLAPERDVIKLTELLYQLIVDPAKREEMGKQGRIHIAEHYNLESQIIKLEGIYSSLEKKIDNNISI